MTPTPVFRLRYQFKMPKLILIVAVSDNNVIGNGLDIPWERIPKDRKRFKKLTMGHPVIMGRITYESLPERFRPLPGRENIVISRNTNPRDYPEGVIVCDSVHKAVGKASNLDKECYVVGGGQIYKQTIGLAGGLEITEIHQTVEGDVFFPPINQAVWEETQREDFGEYSFVTYEQRG